ncbi:hypothetical protein MSG28_004582 [Choristoneura fumiferana]|uniref:Uncharacterized protein n=1 Tax=Choristoneura fumiferana TaxID=7141 RepID=A0ACC0K6K3_CHOFU|nr:hypothetical protein MSG28_004582 [Choristoneura fumiferana]
MLCTASPASSDSYSYLHEIRVTLFTGPNNTDMEVPTLFFMYTPMETDMSFYGFVDEKQGQYFHVGIIRAGGQRGLGRWWLIAGNHTNEITVRAAAGQPGLRPAQSLLTQSNY